MLAVLRIAGIGSTVVQVAGGDERLQLVHLRRFHGVELLTADQSKLGQHQLVVLADGARVGLGVEVAAQLRRQQVAEPRRFVDALTAQQHQDGLVHLLVVYPPGHHAHQPFLQVPVEQFLLLLTTLDRHRQRQHPDGICLSVPLGQRPQIMVERIVGASILRVDDAVHGAVVHVEGLAHIVPQRILSYIVNRPPVGRVEIAILHPAGHHITPQMDVVSQEPLDILVRRLGLAVVALRLVRPFPPDVGRQEGHGFNRVTVPDVGVMTQRHGFGHAHQCVVGLAVRQPCIVLHTELLYTSVVAYLLILAIAVVQLVFVHHIAATTAVGPAKHRVRIVLHQLPLTFNLFLLTC